MVPLAGGRAAAPLNAVAAWGVLWTPLGVLLLRTKINPVLLIFVAAAAALALR